MAWGRTSVRVAPVVPSSGAGAEVVPAVVSNGRVWPTGGAAASRRGGSTAAVPDDQVLELEAGQAVGIVVELAGCPQLRTVTAAGPRGGPVAGHADAGLGYPA